MPTPRRFAMLSSLLASLMLLSTSAIAAADAGDDPPRGAGKSRPRVESGKAISRAQGAEIRAWFANSKNLEGLPPGLRRHDVLPPGFDRQLDRNGKIPTGLEARLHPLPADLERRLSPLPEGFRRMVCGRAVLLLDDKAGRIRDIVDRALPD